MLRRPLRIFAKRLIRIIINFSLRILIPFFFASQEQEELAGKHNVKSDYLEKLKGTSKHYKEVNIENMKIHMKSIEVNTGI